MRPAKFKIFWKGRTKTVILNDNQSIVFQEFRYTSEGWCRSIYDYSRKGDYITLIVCDTGRDCDGSYKDVYEHRVHISELKSRPRGRSRRGYWPNWQMVDSEVNDYSAQNMNY